jgi:hypothetical protein
MIKQIKKKKATPFRLLGETYKGGSAFIEIVNGYSRNYSKKKKISYTFLKFNLGFFFPKFAIPLAIKEIH